MLLQPFVDKVGPSVEALKNMAQLLDGQLKALMAYYGEQPDAADAKKPEDFFGMISSFSTSLQVSVHRQGFCIMVTRPLEMRSRSTRRAGQSGRRKTEGRHRGACVGTCEDVCLADHIDTHR